MVEQVPSSSPSLSLSHTVSPYFCEETCHLDSATSQSEVLTLCKVSMLHLSVWGSNTSRWARRTSWRCQFLAPFLSCVVRCWPDHKQMLIGFDYLSFLPNMLCYVILIYALFVWLISHQSVILFSQNKPITNNQRVVLFFQNKSAPATSQTNMLLDIN
jgi:hypothetical protein